MSSAATAATSDGGIAVAEVSGSVSATEPQRAHMLARTRFIVPGAGALELADLPAETREGPRPGGAWHASAATNRTCSHCDTHTSVDRSTASPPPATGFAVPKGPRYLATPENGNRLTIRQAVETCAWSASTNLVVSQRSTNVWTVGPDYPGRTGLRYTARADSRGRVTLAGDAVKAMQFDEWPQVLITAAQNNLWLVNPDQLEVRQ